jgi:predicted transcriptional regulator YdeE
MEEPTRLRHAGFMVAGLTVRTTNRDEKDPKTGRLPALWGRFFDEERFATTPQRTADAHIYAVYTGYESDQHGAYDVTAGMAVSAGADAVRIEPGDYLVFHNRGQMPQLVIVTWERIWAYFEAHPEIRRRFRTDYEAYRGPNEVAIHVGVS